jgi:hypothetical protein
MTPWVSTTFLQRWTSGPLSHDSHGGGLRVRGLVVKSCYQLSRPHITVPLRIVRQST